MADEIKIGMSTAGEDCVVKQLVALQKQVTDRQRRLSTATRTESQGSDQIKGDWSGVAGVFGKHVAGLVGGLSVLGALKTGAEAIGAEW